MHWWSYVIAFLEIMLFSLPLICLVVLIIFSTITFNVVSDVFMEIKYSINSLSISVFDDYNMAVMKNIWLCLLFYFSAWYLLFIVSLKVFNNIFVYSLFWNYVLIWSSTRCKLNGSFFRKFNKDFFFWDYLHL